MQNLIVNSLGTIDGLTADAAGVRLFLQNTIVGGGSGIVNLANADGAAQFTAPNQPYFQFNGILAQNQVSAAKTLQLNVPNTVSSFTVDFLVSTRAQAKLVINEVLSNPGGTISDANGEWFELYNAGALPVDLKNFLINDYNNSNGATCTVFPCARPSHIIASSVVVSPGGYATLGNTTNTTNNGGVPIDYAYGAVLALANSQDGVRVQYPNPADAANPLTIDQAFYYSAAISAQNGVSRELKNPALDNSNIDNANWADASVTAVYGPGGRGTPKAQNSAFVPPAPNFSNFDSSGATLDAPTAGETVSANLGTISAGQTATVTYRVTLANPLPAGTTQISSQGTVAGDGFSLVTDDTATPAADDATVTPIAPLAPTAASVAIGGRALTLKGRGIRNIVVMLTDNNGVSRTARTNAFGYYRFSEVNAGETYIITPKGKRYSFSQPSQVLNINEDDDNINFIANPR